MDLKKWIKKTAKNVASETVKAKGIRAKLFAKELKKINKEFYFKKDQMTIKELNDATDNSIKIIKNNLKSYLNKFKNKESSIAANLVNSLLNDFKTLKIVTNLTDKKDCLEKIANNTLQVTETNDHYTKVDKNFKNKLGNNLKSTWINSVVSYKCVLKEIADLGSWLLFTKDNLIENNKETNPETQQNDNAETASAEKTSLPKKALDKIKNSTIRALQCKKTLKSLSNAGFWGWVNNNPFEDPRPIPSFRMINNSMNGTLENDLFYLRKCKNIPFIKNLMGNLEGLKKQTYPNEIPKKPPYNDDGSIRINDLSSYEYNKYIDTCEKLITQFNKIILSLQPENIPSELNIAKPEFKKLQELYMMVNNAIKKVKTKLFEEKKYITEKTKGN